MHKLTSRKFWLALGGSATGVGTLIAGITTTNETLSIALSIIGVCLAAVSIVAYNFAEAYVDAKAASSETVDVQVVADNPSSVKHLIDLDPVKIGGTE